MPIVTIDNREYQLDSLSPTAKSALQSLQFVDAELARLASQAAVFETARPAYARALRESLAEAPTPFSGDTLKLG